MAGLAAGGAVADKYPNFFLLSLQIISSCLKTPTPIMVGSASLATPLTAVKCHSASDGDHSSKFLMQQSGIRETGTTSAPPCNAVHLPSCTAVQTKPHSSRPLVWGSCHAYASNPLLKGCCFFLGVSLSQRNGKRIGVGIWGTVFWMDNF